MKLSIVIICWNDLAYLKNCLSSIFAETKGLEFEVILADNGSTDDTLDYVRSHFPNVRIVANGRNLGFGPGNNMGIRVARGEYVLILNPDTIIHSRALERLVACADRHPEAGAWGCRALNPDGTYHITAQPAPTVFRYFCRAFCLRWPGRFWKALESDVYVGWNGRTEREIGFQAACCLLVRGRLLKDIGGFDGRFRHQFEDADLCHRIWESGKSVLFCPDAEITHIGGAKRGCYPVRVVLETERSKYKYFHKHYGGNAATQIRRISLCAFGLRYIGSRVLRALGRDDGTLENRLELYRVLFKWTWGLEPRSFIESGTEPDVGYTPLAPDAEPEERVVVKA